MSNKGQSKSFLGFKFFPKIFNLISHSNILVNMIPIID